MWALLLTLATYWRALFYFWWSNGDFIGCPLLKGEVNLAAKIHVYGIWLDLYLWALPHYRAPSYRHDLLANLRNVALPGTGIPLSTFCVAKPVAWVFFLFLYPLAAMAGAVNVARTARGLRGKYAALAAAFHEHLLAPQDWFSYWRLNSRIAAYHQVLTGSPGYAQEDKWTFLREGARLGVPVSPVLEHASIVVKNKNEEGGLGIYFYRNALAGGDWIIQERLENSDFLRQHLLPPGAPLSTLRVITASRGGLAPADPRLGHAPTDEGFSALPVDHIQALSCVFRAGRAGAATDHASILFDVDAETGRIREGSTNAHWYQLGLRSIPRTPWRSRYRTAAHPDAPARPLTGLQIPDMGGIRRLVRRAHFLMLPDVPLVGWDVALTTKGLVLLEVNLSCNFFRGTFQKGPYFQFCRDYLDVLQKLREENGGAGRQGKKSA